MRLDLVRHIALVQYVLAVLEKIPHVYGVGISAWSFGKVINCSAFGSAKSLCRIESQHRRAHLAFAASSLKANEVKRSRFVNAVERNVKCCPRVK